MWWGNTGLVGLGVAASKSNSSQIAELSREILSLLVSNNVASLIRFVVNGE